MQNKKINLIFVLVIVVALFVCVSGAAFARPWHVDDDLQDYPDASFIKIQDAVDTTSTGDMFIVYSPTAYAGKDLITHVGFPTQFRGYGTSPGDEIIKYEWDFDGDDRFDWCSNLTGQTSHIYNATGTYYAKLRVYDSNNFTAMDSVKVIVKSGKGPQEYIASMLPSGQVPTSLEADGIKSRYVVMINGGYERRFWDDVSFMYFTLISDYNFTADNIYLFNYNGKNPDGENPNNMIDYPARKSNIGSVFSELTGTIDSDDLLFVWVTDHGRGYYGPGTTYYGYSSGFVSIDPGDEQDYLESDFKLRSFCTYGNYYCNQGMDVWKVRYKYSSSHGAYQMYRNKYVNSFTDIYFEGPDAIISDDDIFIERFVDYLLGDTDRDGYIETSEGEVYDYDGDGNPPYDHATGTFDEDDWGEIDKYEDNLTDLNTGVPYNNRDYIIFDDGFDNCVDIDLYSACDRYHLEDCEVSLLDVDGTDLDNQGLFDGIDINDDGDMNDWVSIDEKICLRDDDLCDDEMAEYLFPINAGRIVVVMLPCFSGGFIEDLSDPNRVILTATVEELPSWGNRFLRRFTAALHWSDIYGNPVNADSDGNGYISMLEAFNYAAENDNTPPQYDDNGDEIGHPYPIPNGGDGDLGAVTYLEWDIISPPLVTNPTATPPSIVADGIQESQLNVTVTDESSIATVTVNLLELGGSPTQEMNNIPATDIYTVNTTAAAGTAPDTYFLQVNATDIYGNSNTSVSIALTVTEAADTTPPVIESITLDAYTTIPDATIHITVEATDNVCVTAVTADGATLVETESIWEGNITAPSATGSYTLTIRAEDAAGNVAETAVDYSVVKPGGSIGIGVDPRLTTVRAGDTALITIKLVSTENFDDVAYVYLTTEGVYTGYEANLTWFNWTSIDVKVPAGAEVNVPLEVSIPAGESGYKMFYAKLESTKWTPTAMDTGVLYTI